ncbi:hypothetical protein DPV78_011005 [Talaromyces pinophilus]|nr:hypothetical protein DPV78_011005 [Talaromyces pinophilus]
MPAINPYAMLYVKGMMAIVKNAGIASPWYRQLMSAAALHINPPTITSVQPVAQGGMDAKMGAKNIATKKQRPVTQDVRPVLPPSEIPAPLSIKAVTGGVPKREPIEIDIASII